MGGKALVWIGLFVGSTLGGLIPELWHASIFSLSGVLLSTLGGIMGIVVGWKIAKDNFS